MNIYTSTQMEEITKVEKRTIQRWAQVGLIGEHFGRYYRFSDDDIDYIYTHLLSAYMKNKKKK